MFTLPGGTVSRFLAKGDFNGDGKLDVLLAGRNASAKPVLVVFLGNGIGGFGVPIVTTIAGVNKAQIALAGDLNGDGIQDAVVTGTDTVTGVTEFGVMLADGTGKFKTPVFTRASVAALMTLGDYTGDGKIDLVLLTPGIEVFPGKGDGTFGNRISTSNFTDGCVAVADFNRDGKLDLVTGRDVLLGNGDGTFPSPLALTTGCDIAVGDFNKDGIPDLVTGGTIAPYGTKIFLGNGNGTFHPTGGLPLGYHAGFAAGRGLTIAKFSGDNNSDIAVANVANNDVSILLGNGDGTFNVGKSFAVSTAGLLSGDFNGDGKIDLAAQAQSGFSILLGKGDGTFTAQIAQNNQPGGSVRFADLNGDGKVDAVEFLGSQQNSASASALLGNGDGSFGSPIPLPANCQSATDDAEQPNAEQGDKQKLICGIQRIHIETDDLDCMRFCTRSLYTRLVLD